MKNVVHHVYGCLFDAFDLVRHDILFDRLSHRGLPPLISSFLLNWYKSQELCVRWGNAFSSSFTVSNGVRQGGVLSPVLFTIYMDELLLQLKHNAVGCHWDHHFAGVFCYADDLILLAPSLSALRIMLHILVNLFQLVMVSNLMPQKLSSSDLVAPPPATVMQLSSFVVLDFTLLILSLT